MTPPKDKGQLGGTTPPFSRELDIKCMWLTGWLQQPKKAPSAPSKPSPKTSPRNNVIMATKPAKIQHWRVRRPRGWRVVFRGRLIKVRRPAKFLSFPSVQETGHAHNVIRDIYRWERLMHESIVQNLDLKPDAEGIDEEARRTRTAQRLGPGSGIGA